jgi:hypothetical protein
MPYKIYKTNNYTFIEDTENGDLYEGRVSDFLPRRGKVNSTEFFFTGFNGWKLNRGIELSEIRDVNGNSFSSASDLVDYFTNFNLGGGNGSNGVAILNSVFGDLSRNKDNELIIKDKTDFVLRGGFYYPRKSINPDWISELVRTDIPENDRLTFQDIESDLDLLVDNDLNTIRIVIQYNLTTFGTNPLFDTSFNVDTEKENVLNQFINLCNNKGLKVVTQSNFGYEGELSASDLTEIENYINSNDENANESLRFNSHIDWITSLISSNTGTIIAHKIFNEPDGFGTWSNPETATNVLRFLAKIKQRFISGYSNIPYIVNAVNHVNFNVRFPSSLENEQSLYEISDFAAFNSYYWADNGYFNFVHYRRQFQYMTDNNYLDKPLIMMEFGYPSDYDGQDYIDESNQDESFVPANGQFDRPLDNNSFMPHTQESQDRAAKEAVFFGEKFNAIGLLCWSLFKHEDRLNLGKPSFFQDSFGFIGSDGDTSNTSLKMLSKFNNTKFDSNNIAPFSITKGSVFGSAHINGDAGFSTGDVPAGVQIPIGSGYKSEVLNLKTPYKINLVVSQETQPIDNGIVVGLEFSQNESFVKSLQFRFEDFTNRWRLFELDSNGENEIAATIDRTGDINFDFGTVKKVLTIDLSNNSLKFFVDGVEQSFLNGGNSYNYSLFGDLTQRDIKIICNSTTSDVKLYEAYYTK